MSLQPMATPNPHALRRLLADVGTVDQVGIDERVAKYATRSIKKHAKVFGRRIQAASAIGGGAAKMSFGVA